MSSPFRPSDSTTMVSPLAAPQAAYCLPNEAGGVRAEQVSYECSNTVNDISYPRDEYYWRPCLESLREHGDVELRAVHALHSIEETAEHELRPEHDWYQCPHKVW